MGMKSALDRVKASRWANRRLLLILVIIVLVFLMMDFNNRMSTMLRLDKQEKALQTKMVQLQETYTALEARMEYAQSDKARRNGPGGSHLVKPGDEPLIPELVRSLPPPQCLPNTLPSCKPGKCGANFSLASNNLIRRCSVHRFGRVSAYNLKAMDIAELTACTPWWRAGWYADARPKRPRTGISLCLEAAAQGIFGETADQAALAGELADVTLYLLQLAAVSGIDLEAAVLDKLTAIPCAWPEHRTGNSMIVAVFGSAGPREELGLHPSL